MNQKLFSHAAFIVKRLSKANMRFWLIFIIFSSNCVLAQNQNNTWFFGTYLGMSFTSNSMNPIPDKASPMYSGLGASVMSDKTTGALLLFTDGRNIWDRNKQLMPNGVLYPGTGSDQSSHIIIFETTSKKYFVFYCDQLDNIYYALVDLSLNNGNGDVVLKKQLLASQMDLQFTAVKMLNSGGYWLITHKKGTNEFNSFAVINEQVSSTPVVSYAGSATFTNTQYSYGKMITEATGKRLAYLFFDSDINANTGCILQEFTIDKRCGTISLNKNVNLGSTATYDKMGSISYDQTGKYLYFSSYRSDDRNSLVQFDMSSNASDNGRTLIANLYEIIGDLQLGPNGKIYVASSETRTFTSKISVINAPSLAGINCNFSFNAIELSRNPFLGSIGAEKFPTFISDISETIPNSKKPELKLTANCALSESSFEIKNPVDLIYDSLEWDFGDGTNAKTIAAKHIYNAAGKYLVRFSWFVCNNKFQITDTIKIIAKLNLNLGNDTTLCSGDTFTLKGPLTAEKYLWNTGDTTNTIYLNKPGKYNLKIQSGICTAQDEIEIKYHPPLFTALGEEYFICDKEKELVKLDAGKNFSSYKWTPTGDTTQWIIVGEIGDYFVVVKDFRGCGAKDNTKVKRICDFSVYFPNAFTPNNDGLNDYFSPIGNEIVGFSMLIYNRWGQEVFTSNNLNETWDGNYNNAPCPTDTYYYTTKYQGYQKKKLRDFETKGTFTLLR